VLVVGDAVLDVGIAPLADAPPGGDVPADVRVEPGGQGANVAVRLARRGLPVTLVGAVGDDPAGSLLAAALADDGIRLEAVPAEATGVVAVLLDGTGGRTMYSQRVPFAHRVRRLPASRWIVVSGYLLLEPAAADLAAVLGARSDGVLVLLGCDATPDRRAAWRSAASAARPDLVILNAEEAAWAADDPGALTVVTDASGASALVAGEPIHVGAVPVAAAVDTTGAGDAFAAALIAGLLDRWPPVPAALRGAMESGVRLAAEVVGVRGAQGRVPSEGGRLEP
jgi:sugar/nucleoside kinase (ribokinase family)